MDNSDVLLEFGEQTLHQRTLRQTPRSIKRGETLLGVEGSLQVRTGHPVLLPDDNSCSFSAVECYVAA